MLIAVLQIVTLSSRVVLAMIKPLWIIDIAASLGQLLAPFVHQLEFVVSMQTSHSSYLH